MRASVDVLDLVDGIVSGNCLTKDLCGATFWQSLRSEMNLTFAQRTLEACFEFIEQTQNLVLA